jgi:hypothetical protein
VPTADVLYALDMDWWRCYMSEVRSQFRGALVSPQEIAGVRLQRTQLGCQPTNSGAALLAQAAYWRVKRLVLLGYDCQHTGGRAHWHGDHPDGLGNAGGVAIWPEQFQSLRLYLAGIDIINASRQTALSVFPRASLEDALS